MDKALRLARDRDWSLESWLPLAQKALRHRIANRDSAEKATREAALLVRYLSARGAKTFDQVTPEMVIEWCWAARPDHRLGGRHRPPKPSTARNRQWYAEQIFKELASMGAPVDPAALVGESIRKPTYYVTTRPLSAQEWEAVKASADTGHRLSRLSVIVAFAHAGADPTEIAEIRRRDVDVAAGTVTLPGLATRTNPLCGWGHDVVRRWLHHHPEVADDERLCVQPGTDERGAAKSVTVRMAKVVRRAGLGSVPDVSARSIRLHAGRQVLEDSGIEAAALFLGSPSLDNAARALHYRWWLRDQEAVA